MTRISHSQFDCDEGCSVELALSLIGQKYKGTILYRLFEDDVLRFNEIQRLFPNLSHRTLTTQLRALEQDGIITRTVYPEIPPKVEYRLSKHGLGLKNAISALKQWGDEHKKWQQTS